MESNEKIRQQILIIVENQLKDNNPPETRLTFERLKKEGFNEMEIKQMIGQCLAVEMFDIIKFKKQYNSERYQSNLRKLPNEPFE